MHKMGAIFSLSGTMIMKISILSASYSVGNNMHRCIAFWCSNSEIAFTLTFLEAMMKDHGCKGCTYM